MSSDQNQSQLFFSKIKHLNPKCTFQLTSIKEAEGKFGARVMMFLSPLQDTEIVISIKNSGGHYEDQTIEALPCDKVCVDANTAAKRMLKDFDTNEYDYTFRVLPGVKTTSSGHDYYEVEIKRSAKSSSKIIDDFEAPF